MTARTDVDAAVAAVSRQCRRAHHDDCRDPDRCDCSCHPGGATPAAEPEPVPVPEPVIPATEPVAPPPEPPPPKLRAARKRAARPAGTVAPPSPPPPLPPVRHEVKVTPEIAALIDKIPDGALWSRLNEAGLSDYMADLLIVDRHTVGGRWRIAQEILQ